MTQANTGPNPIPATNKAANPNGVVKMPAVDVVAQHQRANQIAAEWEIALADSLKIAKDTAGAFAKIYAPQLAEQAILMESPDAQVSANARVNLRHLKGQLIMRAGESGIITQQRFEQAFTATIDRVLKLI